MDTLAELNHYWRRFKAGGDPLLTLNKDSLDPKQVSLGLFLLHLLEIPESQWIALQIPALSSELVSITVDYLSSPTTYPWLIKLLLSAILQLETQQISDHRLLDCLIVYLSNQLSNLTVDELDTLLKDPLITHQMTLRTVTLLTSKATRGSKQTSSGHTCSVSSSSPELPPISNGSSILDKYNLLLLQQQQQQQQPGHDNDKNLPAKIGSDCNNEGGRWNEKTTTGLLRLIESETLPAQELILLASRLIVNTVRDRSVTNYCKDYQLWAIISGALEQYQRVAGGGRANGISHQEQSVALRCRLWSSVVLVAVVESFYPTPIARRRPVELNLAINSVLEAAISELKGPSVQDAVISFHWTFLVIYLINNLQFSVDKVNQGDLWNKFNELQPIITRISSTFLAATAATKSRVYGMNVINLLAACLENYKKSTAMTTNSGSQWRNRRRRRRQRGKNKRISLFRSCDSVHHQPMLGSYKRFDCIAEQCLVTLLPLLDDPSAQGDVLKRIIRVGLCCCTANRGNLSVLWRLAYTPSLTNPSLHILRHGIYALWSSRQSGDCRLCAECVNGNECLQNDLLAFYRDAMQAMPRKGPLMLHLLSSLHVLSFSMRTRLVLEVVWRFFCAELERGDGGRREKVDSDSLRYCLMIFSRALHDPELAKMFVTTESVALLIQCRSMCPELLPFVCELFYRSLNGTQLLTTPLMDQMLNDIVQPCMGATQWIVQFLSGRVRRTFLTAFVEVQEEQEEVEMELNLETFGRDGDLECMIKETVVRWQTLARIIGLREEEIDEYLEEHFLHKANVFHVICLAIVFVLDVNREEEGKKEKEGEGKRSKVVESGAVRVEEIIKRLDRLRVEWDCDKGAFLLRLIVEKDEEDDKDAKVPKMTKTTRMRVTGMEDQSSAYHQQVLPVLSVGEEDDISYDQVMRGFDDNDASRWPFSCDIYGDFLAEMEKEENEKEEKATLRSNEKRRESEASEVTKCPKRDSLSLVGSVFNTMRETTGRLINQYVGRRGSSGGEQGKVLGLEERQRVAREELRNVKVTPGMRMRVGQLLDAALEVFVVMHCGEEFGVANMLPALAELKRYVLEQSIDGWTSVEQARTVTRTLEAILKVAEVREGDCCRVRRRRSVCYEGETGHYRCSDSGCSNSAFGSDEEEEEEEEEEENVVIDNEEELSGATEKDERDNLITFTTTLLNESGASVGSPGYDADTEQKISDTICLSDEEDADDNKDEETLTHIGRRQRFPTDRDKFQLHEGVCQIVMEILFELSRKCVADPGLWSTNLNAVLSHLSVVSRSLGGTEAILRGFARVLEASDVRLRELQGSILALVDNIATSGSLTAFTSLFTAERPPVDLLLPKFYQVTVAKMEITEPVCELEFPTRNDNTQRILCDQLTCKGILNIRDYHRRFKLESPFTKAALIYPINWTKFRPWTNSGFTVTTWIKWTERGDGRVNAVADEELKQHVWSVGSNKVLLSVYLNAASGQMSVEVSRPNATLTKEMVQRNRRGATAMSNGNGNGNGHTNGPKRNSSVTNLFMKTMRVEYPDYFITKGALPLGRKLTAQQWQHLAWSVAIFPDQIVLVMTVAGVEQFTVQIPLENGLQATKTSSLSLFCVGETSARESAWTSGYSVTGVLLFKKSIPEVQVLAELLSYGPDLKHPGERCQIERIVPNRGLIGGGREGIVLDDAGPGSLVEMDAVQVIRETILLTFSSQTVDLVMLEGEPLGFLAFGAKLTPRRNRSFATNLVVSGGLDVLLYMFARVVELKETPAMQALALRTVLEAAHRNMLLFSDFKRRHGDAISSVLRTASCDKSLHMLKIILDVAFDGEVLEVVDGGRSYKLTESRQKGTRLLYPELIISTINNFDAWIDESGEETVIEVLFEVLIWLNVSSVRGGHYSKRQLLQANVLDAILNFCKMHVGGISSRIRVTRTMAERLVELLGIYGPSPPGADYLDELAKLLLLIQEPSCVFVTQDRVNYYYLLAACPPDRSSKMGLTRTATRWTSGLRMIQRKRRAAAELERSRHSSQDTLWKARSSMWEMSVDAGDGVEAVVVAGEEDSGGRRIKERKLKRRMSRNVRERVLEVATVRDGDKIASHRIESRDVVRVNRAIHNRKVAQRRRTIERKTPLYNRLRAHVRKKENKNSLVDLWSLNFRRLAMDQKEENLGTGASTLQRELLRLLRSYVILLPDNMVTEVLDHYVTIELLIVLANNADGGVRSQLLRLLAAMCNRMDAVRFHLLLEGFKFVHLANQLVIYPVNLEMIMTCRRWAQGEEETAAEQEKRNVGLIFLVAMLPHMIARHENTFVGCLQLLSEQYEVCSVTRKFLMQRTLLIPTLVKCWLKVYAKRPFLNLFQRPGSHLLMFSYQICKSLFLSTGGGGGGGSSHGTGGVLFAGGDALPISYPTIWDFLNGLDFVGSSSLAVPVRRGMRVIQAKILNGLLRQCLREREEPHERYMRGFRKLQSLSIGFMKNGKSNGHVKGGGGGGGAGDVKVMFNQLMERSILFVQCKDSQYEPRAAEEDLVKTIIRLGLATRLKIGTVITWAMSPFRSIDLRLFVIKCLTHLMKSKHVKTYGLNISIIRIFTKKFVGDVLVAVSSGVSDTVTERNLKIVRQFARFLNTDTTVDLWALLKAMSKIDEISCKIKEDRAAEMERSVHKYEPVAADCMEMSVQMTRRFVEAQNTDRRDLINQLRAEKRQTYQWRPLISRMTHENAPFHNPRYFPNSWEMDETEGPSRVRLRMKRCFPATRRKFLLPEFQEMHANVAAEPPLQFLVDANVKSRSSITDQVLYNFPAAQIKGDTEVNGDLVVTETVITFFPEEYQKGGKAAAASMEPIIIEVNTVIDIFMRRYLHQEKSVELFLTSGHTVLFLLHEPNDRKTFESYFADKVFDPCAAKWHMFVLQQWREGQLTNWEYLTALNQLGGRSFQDLMQYPVFPWVLADYESSILDLRRRESFRNLERPIAVQRDESRAYYEAGYEHLASSSFGAPGTSYNVSHFPYHFPCHYSNSGTVFGFLIRVQPYTQMFIRYQDGHFDLPDRTFFSMQHAWRLASRESTTDVKELLPEFFTLPEMFENGEGFDFGVCQGGDRVDHVNLPAWSNHSARLFTLVHRQALESDIVRDNLRNWVDLIFGYKQSGEEAKRATNVFHSATYPDYANPPSDDPLYKMAYATMVRTYGQMPKQLLMQPHPESLVKAMGGGAGEDRGREEDQIVASHCSSVKGLKWGKYAGSPDLPAPERIQLIKRGGPDGDPVRGRRLVSLEGTNTVYVVPENANYMQGLEVDTINCVTWRSVDHVVRLQRMAAAAILNNGGEKPQQSQLFAANDHLDEIVCCGTHVYSNQLWLGYASGRIVVYQVDNNSGGSGESSAPLPADKLNKMRFLQKSYLANTMSYNSAFRMFKSTGTAMVSGGGGAGGIHSWQRRPSGKQQQLLHQSSDDDLNRLQWTEEVTLLFHTDSVVDIRISPEFRIAVSVGVDGRAAIWDTNKLEFVRQIEPPTTTSGALSNRVPIALLAISQTMGDVVTVHRSRERAAEKGGDGEEEEEEEDRKSGAGRATDDDESYEVTENNIDDFVRVSTSGFAGGKKTLMRLHTINAKYVNHVTVPERILCVAMSHVKEGIGINVVATGFENGTIKLWSSWDLSFVRQIDTHLADVVDLCFSTYQHLVVLTKDDFIQVWESKGLLGNAPKFPQVDCKR